jgi:hypothetical protein
LDAGETEEMIYEKKLEIDGLFSDCPGDRTGIAPGGPVKQS